MWTLNISNKIFNLKKFKPTENFPKYLLNLLLIKLFPIYNCKIFNIIKSRKYNLLKLNLRVLFLIRKFAKQCKTNERREEKKLS